MAARGLKKVLTFCEEAGFFYSSNAECGIKYGHLGTQLKKNIIDEWWRAVVTSVDNVYGVDSPVLCPGKISNQFDAGVFCAGETENKRYLRPHLNQEPVYHLYKKMLKAEISFGVAEVGKVFKLEKEKTIFKYFSLNSVYLYFKFCCSSSEPEMGVLQFFCCPSEYKNWCSQWQKRRLHWWKKFAVNPEKFSLGKGDVDDTNLLSTIGFQFPDEVCNLEIVTGKESIHSDEESSLATMSLSTTIDQAVFAFVYDAYMKTSRPYGKSASKKYPVLRFHACLAPYKVAVIPQDVTNPKLNMYCKRLAEELRQVGIATASWSKNSYEEELLLQDEIGTPFRVIGSDKTLETGTVMLQNRDTTLEEEMNGRDVLTVIQSMLLGASLN